MTESTSLSPLRDAFGHHVWATIAMLDACSPLTTEQLATTVPGTYGSILDTFRHLVAADSGYLFVLTNGEVALLDEASLDVPTMRAEMVSNGGRWSSLLAQDLDIDSTVSRHRDDGSTSYAPLGIRLTQATQHGTDHRSQIATALTSLGIEPPDIDVWSYADSQGRLSVDPAPA
jgi:uncharacterized damage-inducible protein DinB